MAIDWLRAAWAKSVEILQAREVRSWITISQDQYQAGDDPFWRAHQNDQRVVKRDEALELLGTAIARPEVPDVVKRVLRQGIRMSRRCADNLHGTSTLVFRLCWLSLVPAYIGWVIYLSLELNEWGMLLGQLVVLARTADLAISIGRNKRCSGWNIYKFYENRILGALPVLIFYHVTVIPAYRHLYGDWLYTGIVIAITGCWLIVVSFWWDLAATCAVWFLGLIRRVILNEDVYTQLKDVRDALSGAVVDLRIMVDEADISDLMADTFGVMKRSDDLLLRLIDAVLRPGDRRPRARYSRWPKIPHFVGTNVIYGVAMVAFKDYPLLVAETGGWAVWAIARMGYSVFSGFVSRKDTARVFSATVAGVVIAKPLTISMLVSKNAVLDSVPFRWVMGIWLVVSSLLFSNLVGDCCEWLGEMTFGKSNEGGVGGQRRVRPERGDAGAERVG